MQLALLIVYPFAMFRDRMRTMGLPLLLYVTTVRALIAGHTGVAAVLCGSLSRAVASETVRHSHPPPCPTHGPAAGGHQHRAVQQASGHALLLERQPEQLGLGRPRRTHHSLHFSIFTDVQHARVHEVHPKGSGWPSGQGGGALKEQQLSTV